MYYQSIAISSLLLVGSAAALPQGPHGGNPGGGQPGFGGNIGSFPTSPDYSPYIFEYPVFIPPIAVPQYTETVNGRQIQYYELTLGDAEHQVYPNLGPTQLTAYNGTVPGPTFQMQKGVEAIVRMTNQGSNAAAMHLHGSPTHAPWDGWAVDTVQPGQYKDYYYPNSQSGPLFYHDHVEGVTATDVYYGQCGVYIIFDPAEDELGLPTGVYDVPLALTDKTYNSDGSLLSPDGFNLAFYGDTIQVNEQPWPYMNVEPRFYRLRFYDMSLSRPYDLYFVDDATGDVISTQVIASDGGLFEAPVTTADIVISMGGRYETMIDFSGYKGGNVTLMNQMQIEGGPSFPNTDKVMRFIVGEDVTSDANNAGPPSTLRTVNWPTEQSTVDQTFDFQHGGDDLWTINGVGFNDANNRVLARPEQGTTELWQFNYRAGPGVHPVHIHLVNFKVVSRTGGRGTVLPYEAAGLKDVLLMAEGETVETLAFYGPWNGVYMFHCHNLIHEDSMMMAAFNVTAMMGLGYTDIQEGLYDPLDKRFSPQDATADAYSAENVQNTIQSLGKLNAYATASAAAVPSASAAAAPSASAAAAPSASAVAAPSASAS